VGSARAGRLCFRLVRPAAADARQRHPNVQDARRGLQAGELQRHDRKLVYGRKVQLRSEGALAGYFPTFTAPREGVYVLEISLAAAAGGGRTCTVVAEFSATASDRRGYAKLFTLQAWVGAALTASVAAALYALGRRRKQRASSIVVVAAEAGTQNC
jgi:hypothetical protein